MGGAPHAGLRGGAVSPPMAGVGPLALPAAPAPRGLPLYRPPPLAAWAVMPISAGGGPAGALCRTLAHRYFRTPAVGISGKMRSNAVLLTRKLTRQQRIVPR
jgi:hypothetical protein